MIERTSSSSPTKKFIHSNDIPPSSAFESQQSIAVSKPSTMPPITIRSPPPLDSYTLLSEYQTQTPETFHGGKPVLYYHATGAKAWIPKTQRGSLPVFPADSTASAPTGPEGIVLNGDAEELIEERVELFVNSEYDYPWSSLQSCLLTGLGT